MKRLSILAIAALVMAGCNNKNRNINDQDSTDMNGTEKQEHYTFELSDKVIVKK